MLESATANFQASELGGTLTVSIAPSFASRWLLKRLGKFRALYPTIAIEPEIASNLLDFGRSHIDVAIRHGSGAWPGLNAEKLFDETLWMVGSPQVANTILAQDGTIDFAKAVLLTASVRTGELKIWLDESGSGGPEGREVIHYPTQALALDGAVSGLGVALADYRIVEDEVKEGRLVQVTDQTVQTGRGYYLVWPKGQALDAKSHAFMTWLAEEISRHANGYS
ncbi:MAG: LysR substrate-binding domain-containing protein [Rhodospirillaceae bacterium]|nr:LysR substrate-binding domain-containing protein [Rhodospirillaceae bacterium]MDD9913613.1 LysR substrate-binding domain-containing protein [Rhodospirillaceae bacterium]MDD9925395.1 LysR substrate-binding domain-containing protein [Rhodospirillaceae bacterium]